MKASYSRRYRRSSARSRESAIQKKDLGPEHTFFAGPSSQRFFKPNMGINRKCDHCEAEEKKAREHAPVSRGEQKVRKMSDTKEEEKLNRQADKKEEDRMMRAPENKEEKKLQRLPQNEDEQKLKRLPEKKEEEKLQRLPEKEEEQKLKRLPEKKEEEKLQRSPNQPDKEALQRNAGNKEEEKLRRSAEPTEKEPVQRSAEKKEEEQVNRTGEKKEEEKTILKKDNSSPAPQGIAATGAYIQTLPGKGSRLPDNSLHFFSSRMGYDFSNVKIHTGADAEQSAKNVNAKAYTIGNDIVFNKGQYNPTSFEGKKLLAHELAHVAQQQEAGGELLNRVAEHLEEENGTPAAPFVVNGQATNTENKVAYGCAGVNVQGQTDANYSDSFSSTVNPVAVTSCTECAPPDCISASGIIISRFRANPVITLPSVPGGLTECEARAVERFINTTLRRHEQQHVAAFNTYTGVVRTPYRFTGCRSEIDSYLQSIHDGINAQRQASSNALSSALDPFNATIPCDCPDD